MGAEIGLALSYKHFILAGSISFDVPSACSLMINPDILISKKILYVISAIILLFAGGIFLWSDIGIQKMQESDRFSINIGGHIVNAVIADSPEEREKGLGGRTSLESNEGMLFIFEDEELYSFWMKDMFFSIDILWISSGGKIVDVRRRVSPETYPESFTPRAPARYVLELPAGLSEEYNLDIGDEITM